MLDARCHATGKRLNTRVKDWQQATHTGDMDRAQEEAATDPELDRANRPKQRTHQSWLSGAEQNYTEQ